ncbi:MAG: hypothetical protein M3032_07015 [Verrucomicrobiota bacterium]|nr:hypothetical protein [Verrucomicrobiota bacterium]
MSNRRLAIAAIAAAAICLAGCTTPSRTTMLAPARAAITSTDGVRVYRQPPKRFQEIAIVEGKSLTELRSKAALVGANGILAAGVVRKPGPTLAIGIGSGTYGYDRHSAYGVETEASFGVPTGSNVLTATAIYVP